MRVDGGRGEVRNENMRKKIHLLYRYCCFFCKCKFVQFWCLLLANEEKTPPALFSDKSI